MILILQDDDIAESIREDEGEMRRLAATMIRGRIPCPAFGAAVSFHDILVRTRPTPGVAGAQSKPTRFFIDAARVSVSTWSLLSASKTFSVALAAFGGHVDFEQKGTPGGKKGAFASEIHAREVKMAELPGVKSVKLCRGIDGDAEGCIYSGERDRPARKMARHLDAVVAG